MIVRSLPYDISVLILKCISLKAFYVSVNSNINTGDTFISEKAEWRKLDITGYGHYSTKTHRNQ